MPSPFFVQGVIFIAKEYYRTESEYLKWIFDVVDGWDYSAMLKQLHLVEFYSDVWLDENIVDKVYIFRDKMGADYDGPEGKPSVLEIFVTLAVECEDKLMHDDARGNRTAKWFWMILENLGIDRYDDIHYTANASEKISDIIDIFLERDYDYCGKSGGCAFPCEKPFYDIREAALWEQMNWYLSENYMDEFRDGVYDI